MKHFIVVTFLSLIAATAALAQAPELVIVPQKAWLGPRQDGSVQVTVWLTRQDAEGKAVRALRLRHDDKIAKVEDGAEAVIEREFPIAKPELASAQADPSAAGIELEFSRPKAFGRDKLGSAAFRLAELDGSSRENPLRWSWVDSSTQARVEGIAFHQVAGVRAPPSPAVGPAAAACFPNFLFISRHAERIGADELGLTEAGHVRARQLERLFSETRFDVMMATTLLRTQETLAPVREAIKRLARQEGRAEPEYLEIKEHDTAATIRAIESQCGKTVLVVTHSGTIPGLMHGLGVQSSREYGTAYGDLMLVQRSGGQTRSIVLRYGQ